MQLHFTAEQQAQLEQIAAKAGANPEQLVTNVVARFRLRRFPMSLSAR
jgi:hypothetical protein